MVEGDSHPALDDEDKYGDRLSWNPRGASLKSASEPRLHQQIVDFQEQILRKLE